MGLINFIKEAGAYLFGAGAGTAVAATQAKPVTPGILKGQVNVLGVPVENLSLAFADPVATVSGTVASQSDKEKVVLAVGNTPGVGQVDDQLTVKAAASASSAGPASTRCRRVTRCRRSPRPSAVTRASTRCSSRRTSRC